jgi:hypothetical protein
LDYDKDYVEVKFDPPEKENGAPVQGYIIEFREKGEKDWKKVRSEIFFFYLPFYVIEFREKGEKDWKKVRSEIFFLSPFLCH